MQDIWEYLKQTDKPIVMYGMGNGADKILERFEHHGITVSDFFASDGFVRGHFFHGKRVLTLHEVEEKYGDFIIILSFASSLDDVLGKFYYLDEKYEMYAPDVPVTGGGTFDYEYYYANREKIEAARQLLCDDTSKKVFDCIINYKLSGKIKYLREADSSPDEAWSNILSPDDYKVCVDAGAYNGDTAREMLCRCRNIEKIYALEPDARNYRKLSSFAENEPKVIPLNFAAWNEKTVLYFDSSGNRNSSAFSFTMQGKKNVECSADTIDGIDSPIIDYIKYDTEGAERQAILGTKQTIERCSPDLLISLYHRNEDIFDLPLLINSIDSGYKLYLRKFKYVPAWDLNLYAVKER